jgi:hypothetical protein
MLRRAHRLAIDKSTETPTNFCGVLLEILYQQGAVVAPVWPLRRRCEREFSFAVALHSRGVTENAS